MNFLKWGFTAVIIFCMFLPFDLSAQTSSSLTFSEIMFTPAETNGEFVEIYNTSTTETVDLTNYKFKYYTSSNNNIIALSGGMLLGPGKFAVILQGSYDYTNGIYKTLIPADALVLKISTNSFGSSGMANTISREVNLINASGQTIDTYTYSANNSAGISDEKYILSKDNTAENWKNSLTTNGTPGKKNSVSPLNNDLNVSFSIYTPVSPIAEDTLKITIKIMNNGVLAAANFSVNIFNDANNDSLGQAGELIFNNNYTNLASGDSIMIQRSVYASSAADYHFIAITDYSADENTANDTAFLKITVAEKPAASNEIVINEFMYAPSNDEPEWIELYNRSYRAINLKNWKVTDNSTTITISTTDYFLNPGEYLVIASDATISNYYQITSKLLIKQLPSLNNSGDNIILKSNLNTAIDSLKYASSWGGSGNKSLERVNVEISSVDPSNWKTSLSKYRATPGGINSVTAKNKDLSVKQFVLVSIFAEVGKQIQLKTEIENLGSDNVNNFAVRFYKDINNNSIGELNELISEELQQSINAGQIKGFILNTTNFEAGSNHFLVIVEYGEDQFQENNSALLNITGLIINEMRGDLVINEIMYAPNSSEPEWIEVYNRSTKIIDMHGYKIADDATTTRVINTSLVLNPSNYLVIAKDSSIVTLHNNIPLLRISTFASLNNSGDRVMLLDSMSRVIDSLDYKSTWGGNNGKSLERVDVNRSSVDSTNWKTSTAVSGSTPGYFNSATPYDNNLALSILSHSPLLPIKGDSVSIIIKIENIGNKTADNFSLVIYDDVNRDSVAQSTEIISIKNYTSLASSTVITTQIKIYAAEVRAYRIIAKLNFSTDEVLSNNTAFREYSVSEIPASVNEIVINEIMYAPSSDEPEWIEIYNSSNRALNLKDWKIGDSAALTTISSTEFLFSPGEYLVISGDASISSYYNITSKLLIKSLPSLSNTGDDVRLKDNSNRTIDSVKYLPAWGGNSGKSLERKYADSLSNRQSNWETSISPNKATPGKFNSISPLGNNLSVSILSVFPAVPIIGDSVTVTIKIENIGKNRTDNFSMEVFNDINLDFTPQETERISIKNISSLVSFSSITFQTKVYAAEIRLYRIIVKVNYYLDEDLSDNLVMKEYTTVEVPAFSKEIVVNEIMYAPFNDEPEWVELINKSSRVLNLKNWKIGDNTSLVVISTSDYILNPGEYLIVSSDSAISNYYKISSKLLIKTLPSLNNSGDNVILKSNLNITIDSLKYASSWGGNGNKSLERVNVEISSADPSNWKTSLSKLRATPGRINSVTIKANDLSLKSVTSSMSYAEISGSVKLNIVVENIGLSVIQSYSIKIYKDRNLDSIEALNELIGEIPGTNIALNSSRDFDFTTTNILSGVNQFIVKIDFVNDEYPENNIAFFQINGVTINEIKSNLVINEIMYHPTKAFEKEWIEIFNNSNKQIELKGYQILNNSSSNKIVNSSFLINPEEYVVISRDSSIFSLYQNIGKVVVATFPSLNDSGDRVVLQDSLDRAIDSLAYKSLWGGTGGKSLERIDAGLSSTDSLNWRTTINTIGATPGFVNSVSKKNFDVTVTRVVFTPFNPLAGQRVTIQTEIFNIGKQSALYKIVLNEINRDGSKTTIEESPQLTLDAGQTFNYDFNYVIESIYVKRNFEVIADYDADEDQTNNKYLTVIRPGYLSKTVLVNEIMYNPANGEPEWIELYNNSQYDIDLEEWSITDVLTTPLKTKILANNYNFPSKTFLVVAKDSTIKNYHGTISSKLIISTFANLNNDADGIVLKDAHDVTIDSVRYDSFWGGANGKSLERKFISASSIDRNNWSSSRDIELSTPGRVNSITQKKFDLTINSISSTPQYPAFDEEVYLKAKVVNYGSEIAAAFKVKFYLRTNNVDSFLSEGQGENLNGSDSIWVTSSLKIKLNDNKTILCKVIFSNDEDTLNNSFITEIRPGAKRNSVLVSEVMYDPLTGESEWIEIYNASSDAVNLINWSISDLLPSPTKSVITLKDNFLNPGEYAIIAYDTLKYPYYPPEKFFQAKFGALSSTDGVLIYDFRNAIIDSLKYNSGWGGAKGFSLERLSYNTTTNDSLNWATTLNPNGGTGGIQNSVVSTAKYQFGTIVINEIMFDPATGGAEYLEFYNTSNDSIQLGGMEIRIGSLAKFKLANTFYKLPPQNYFVLASDSSIYRNFSWLKLDNKTKITGSSSLSLSNEGALLILKDLLGDTLDSLVYFSSWHNKNILTTKGRSLERLNPLLGSNIRFNWNTSAAPEGGSPGKQNSIFSENNSHESKVVISPNPFSPDNDGYEDYTIINFDLTQPLSQVRIKVFDSLGRLVRNIAENRLASSKNSVIFDGLDDNGRPLRIGIYILLIEAVAEGSGNVDVIKTPVVVARKL